MLCSCWVVDLKERAKAEKERRAKAEKERREKRQAAHARGHAARGKFALCFSADIRREFETLYDHKDCFHLGCTIVSHRVDYENKLTYVVNLVAPYNANCICDGRRTREVNEDHLIFRNILDMPPSNDEDLNEELEDGVSLIQQDIKEYKLHYGLDDDGWEQAKKAKRAVEERESEQDDRLDSLRRLPEAKRRPRLRKKQKKKTARPRKKKMSAC